MDSPSSIVVKNTFLEIGDDDKAEHGLRRRMSEPILTFTSQDDRDVLSAPARTSELTMTPSTSDVCESEDDFSMRSHSVAMQFSELRTPSPRCSFDCSSCSHEGARVTGYHTAVAHEAAERLRREVGAQRLSAEACATPRSCRVRSPKLSQQKRPWRDITTVMVRNLPNKYTQQKLLEDLCDQGFFLPRDFDFFYLPMDHASAANLGYCFVNFVTTEIANRFAAIFQGIQLRRYNSAKTIVVMPASVQGYEQNYAYYSTTRVAKAQDPQFRPIFARPEHFHWAGRPPAVMDGTEALSMAASVSPMSRTNYVGTHLLGGECPGELTCGQSPTHGAGHYRSMVQGGEGHHRSWNRILHVPSPLDVHAHSNNGQAVDGRVSPLYLQPR